jgi:hypothetical protein
MQMVVRDEIGKMYGMEDGGEGIRCHHYGFG